MNYEQAVMNNGHTRKLIESIDQQSQSRDASPTLYSLSNMTFRSCLFTTPCYSTTMQLSYFTAYSKNPLLNK